MKRENEIYINKPVSKSKVGHILRFAIITVALIFLFGAAAGFAYVKYIEKRLHAGGNLDQAQKAISEPVGKEPINLLLLGSDARSKDENARSDTIIILRLNPLSKKVYLISIPRDMRVKIPGYGWNKINAANALGGPELAIRTVEDFTEFTIHHYVEINFEGFKKMVDKLGGIEIYVEKPLIDKPSKFGISAGHQLMDGERALNYVRFRKDAKGDFGRIERQQKFFYALINKALRLQSIFKLHGLIKIFTDNAETDFTSGEIFGIANFLKSVDKDTVEMVTLPGEVRRIDGKSFVVPKEEVINEIMQAIEEEKPIALAKNEGESLLPPGSVKIMVLNGCGISNIAEEAASELQARGYKTIVTANASNFDYEKTIIRYNSKLYDEAKRLQGLFKDAVFEPSDFEELSSSDIVIVLGKGYAK